MRRPITRVLIESHIKAKLGELRTAYVQIEQSIPNIESAHSLRSWLRDTEDSLARFSGTLTVMSLVRRVIAALWPLIIALVAVVPIGNAIFSLFSKENLKTGILGGLGYLALLAAFYIILGLAVAAHKKRGIFLTTGSTDRSTGASGNQDSGIKRTTDKKNVYEIEDELFSCIGISKRPAALFSIYTQK